MEDEDESGESEEEEDEVAPVIRLQTRKKRHSFVKLLLALWPFGESFKELGLLGKIYEILKVGGTRGGVKLLGRGEGVAGPRIISLVRWVGQRHEISIGVELGEW